MNFNGHWYKSEIRLHKHLKELFNVVYCKQGITVRTINPL